MKIFKMLLILSFLFLVSFAETKVDRTVVTIGIIGDSTVSNYEATSLMRGWGQILPEFFIPDAIIINKAERGRSTKTFPAERWQKILSARPNFVLIQFGHNDSHGRGKRESTDPQVDYKGYLREYIRTARDRGIEPILVTPPHRRRFKEGNVTNELKPYVQAMKEVGKETVVAVVDLYEMTGREFQSLGETGSSYFTINMAGEQEKDDRTHFTEAGARRLAQMVASELGRIYPLIHSSLLHK